MKTCILCQDHGFPEVLLVDGLCSQCRSSIPDEEDAVELSDTEITAALLGEELVCASK